MKKKIVALLLVAVLFVSAAPTVTLGAVEGFARMLVPPTLVFDAVYTFRDGMAWVRSGRRVGFVNQFGDVVIPLEFEFVSFFFNDGLARARYRGRYGFIDKTGEWVIPRQFSYAQNFRNGIAQVVYDNRFGVINTSGEMVVPNLFSSLSPFGDGLFIARKGAWGTNTTGVVDLYGNTLVPFEYANLFGKGYGLLGGFIIDPCGGRRTGIINLYNEVILPF